MSPQFYTVIRKILVWGVVLFLCAILQTTVFAPLMPWGAVPDLMLAATTAIAIFDSERAGAVAGIAAGVMIGALGGTGFNALPLVYMLCGYLFGIWSTMSLSANLPSWFVYILTGAAVRAAVTLISVSLSYTAYSLLTVAATVLLPDFAATVLFSLIIYFPLRRIAQLFNRRLRMPE